MKTKEDFFELAANRIKYKILKPLPQQPDSLITGEKYFSDTLYEAGYNMEKLVQHGYLQVCSEPFKFQKDIIGKNIHSVVVKCPECGTTGVNDPLNTTCGNCNYPKAITYYDAETINDYIQSLNK